MYNNYMHKVKTFFWFLKSTYRKYSVWKYEWIWKLWLIWIKLHLYAKNLLLTMLQYTKITFTLKRKKHFIYSKICPKIEYNWLDSTLTLIMLKKMYNPKKETDFYMLNEMLQFCNCSKIWIWNNEAPIYPIF